MRIGLVGCGFIGIKHAVAIAQAREVELVAVSDPLSDRMGAVRLAYEQRLAARSHVSPRLHPTVKSLLADEDVEVVVVTTPSGSHSQICLSALLAGKHVIVEKPMALDLASANAMVHTAARHGLKLAVCHQRRFLPHLNEIRSLIRQGSLGDLMLGSVSLICNRSDEYYRSSPWRGTWSMDGGVLLNQTIHDIDLLRWLMGDVKRVTGTAVRLMRPIEAEDTAVLALELASGALGRIEATTCASPAFYSEQLTLIGTRATLTLSGKQLETVQSWGMDAPVFSPTDTYKDLYEDMRRAIENGCEPRVTGHDALRTLEIVLAGYESVLTGRSTELPLSDFSTTDMRNVFDIQGGDNDVRQS